MTLQRLLTKYQNQFASLLDSTWKQTTWCYLDCAIDNKDLQQLDSRDPIAMRRFAQRQMQIHGASLSLGRYNEVRDIYQQQQFQGRCVHLGIDINLPQNEPIYCPLDAVIHSFADNHLPGDYGPTLILQHQLEDQRFYTLYGHLSRRDLTHWHIGKNISQGALLGHTGSSDENGGWPAHLHLQIIENLEEHQGDYPGVCSMQDRSFYLHNCPDPESILIPNTLNRNQRSLL